MKNKKWKPSTPHLPLYEPVNPSMGRYTFIYIFPSLQIEGKIDFEDTDEFDKIVGKEFSCWDALAINDPYMDYLNLFPTKYRYCKTKFWMLVCRAIQLLVNEHNIDRQDAHMFTWYRVEKRS